MRQTATRRSIPPQARLRPAHRTVLFALGAAAALAACDRGARGARATRAGATGVNPAPVRLTRPSAAPLSAVAEIGRAMFFDARLSGPGTMSCATCHSPAFAYGPPNALPVQRGGPSGRAEGARAVPSLRYADRAPAFALGPALDDADSAQTAHAATRATDAAGVVRQRKTAGAPPGPPPMVPRGGLFWDGRAGTLQTQAVSPLLDAAEMANRDSAALAAKLRRLGYALRIARALGTREAETRGRLLDQALFALARFQVEDPSFHPYGSRYDRWLEGRDTLTAAEVRGLRVFEDPKRGNCAACHLDQPGADGRPPAFTDWEYEALGVPRNHRLTANRDPAHADLGLCGPVRTDLVRQRQWCGMFRTPSLRNAATRRAFFHNGVYHTLDDVLRFYDFRDTRPDSIYPVAKDGSVLKFNDLPAPLRVNVDVTDAPFGRKRGDPPPMTEQEMRDVISFLKTLSDSVSH